MRRRGTLGPFPKTRPLRAFFDDPDVADAAIHRLRREYVQLSEDTAALDCVVLWAALPIVTRFESPEEQLQSLYGWQVTDHTGLAAALDRAINAPAVVREAAKLTVLQVAVENEGVIARRDWLVWRQFDGSDFCLLGNRFFANLNYFVFSRDLRHARDEEVRRLAQEMSIITRTFSARWYNACARHEVPSRGNIGWYFRHCMGKLDLELSRELTGYVEEPRPRRKRQEPLFEM
jgi:hypothetical protein